MVNVKQVNPMDEKQYTVAQVAEHFQVSRQAVYNWINEGRLRVNRVGNRARIPASAIAEFVRPMEPGEALGIEED